MLERERVEKDVKASDVELSSVELSLPSKCGDYPAPARGPFKIRPPRVREVEFMADMGPDNYDEQLTKLLRSLIVSPTIVDPADLTLGDRQYLHVWVRAQLDPVYRFTAKCPACGKVDEDYQLEIEKIPLVPVQDKYKPKMKLELPNSKKVVAVRLETGRDRILRNQMIEKGIGEWTARSAMIIVSADGRTMTPEERCDWLRTLPGGDLLFMTQYVKWQMHGPDFSKCPFKCKHQECGKESVLDLPFRLEFFLPTVHAASAFDDAIRGCGDGEDGGVSGDAGDQADGVRGVSVGEEAAPRAEG